MKTRPRLEPFARRRAKVTAIVLIPLLLVGSSARRAEAASDPDPWFGRDKMLHFSVATLIAGGTYTLAATQFEARYPPLLIGAGTTLALGAAKEVVDGMGQGTPSWKDFTWDVVGTVVGLGVAWSLDLLIRGVSREHPLFGAPSASASALHGARPGGFVLRW